MGLASSLDDCEAGFYCTGSAIVPNPVDGVTGNQCTFGQFCPAGSSSPSTCTAGSYCGAERLGNVSGACSIGFYCTAGSRTDKPFNETGGKCPAGSYCPVGSSVPVPCPAGTFNSLTQRGSEADCAPCTNGYYCNGTGLTTPTGPCYAGYICNNATNGNAVPDPYWAECPIGYYCPNGTAEQFPCPAGTYQDLPKQSTCKNCTAGNYCPGSTPSTPQGPITCPAGYYCPIGTSRIRQYPCPAGTYSTGTGLTSATECTGCPVGSYCTGQNPTAITGSCYKGYYCKGNASVPNPSDGVTGDICPSGFYCLGTVDPIVCPAGSYRRDRGAEALSDCYPCDAGHYCDGTGSITPCAAGYACSGSAIIATPTDGVTGHQCPAGSSCPAGSVYETPCEPGSFAASAASGSCAPCTAGQYCPFFNMTSTELCPAGYYCPTGSAEPQACPLGTYSNQTGLEASANCTRCDPGYYCNRVAMQATSGLCRQGFICSESSDNPTPEDDTLHVPKRFGYCPKGNYCPYGTDQPQPCPAGTFLNTTLNIQCQSCLAGSYCAGTGLEVPTGLCDPGYFCNNGSDVSNPTDGVKGDICPPGHMCPGGSPYAKECDAGTYQDQAGQTSCKTCPSGFVCNNFTGTVTPELCPTPFFCPAGTAIPMLCPNGTYGSTQGLGSVSSCTACPAGKYCTSGRIQGNCSAGFICYKANYKPNPVNVTDSITFELLGDLCPIGGYCDEGTTEMTPCGDGLFNGNVGGSGVFNCTLCPPGYFCKDLDNHTYPCPAGTYCPVGSASPTNCSIGTYNVLSTQGSSLSCLPCPAGFMCNQEGIANFNQTQYLCPIGKYCVEGCLLRTNTCSVCPPGTQRKTPGAAAESECSPCQAAYYCPENSTTGFPCPASYYCPTGTWQPKPCVAGFYCPAGSPAPITCTAGYYCPANSSLPTPCYRGTYCPAGTATPLSCPAGYYAPSTTTVSMLGSLSTACKWCPDGTFSNDTSRKTCTSCPAGYVCVNGTYFTTHDDIIHGSVCPAGSYCPAGSAVATPCPPGSYNALTGQGYQDNCTVCPENTYNDIYGSRACFACGSSSSAPANATVCSCVGRNRAFQRSDGSCVCKPGFAYYVDNVQMGDDDSPQDCEPLVYERCGLTQVRTAYGNCVDKTDCASSCSSGVGQYIPTLGICDCGEGFQQAVVCDKACRNSAPQLSMTADGMLSYVGSDGYSTSTDVQLIDGFLGSVSCDDSDEQSCRAYVVDTSNSSTGYQGVFYPTETISTALNLTNSGSARRLTSAVSAGIVNPVVCLSAGETLFFQLSDNGTSYPVYMKDSLLNSNPDFDYGQFRQLAQALNAHANAKLFGFTFTVPGTYVFANSNDLFQQIIVGVMGPGQQCKSSQRISSRTTQSLLTLGAKRNDDLITNPDWVLIAGLTIAFIGIASAIIYVMWNFRHKIWSKAANPQIRYRENSKFSKMETFGAKEAFAGADAAAKLAKTKLQSNVNPADPNAATAEDDVELSWDLQDNVSDEIDPRLFQAVYDRLLRLQTYASTQFQQHSTQQEQQAKQILSEAKQLQSTLETRLSLLAKASGTTVEELLKSVEVPKPSPRRRRAKSRASVSAVENGAADAFVDTSIPSVVLPTEAELVSRHEEQRAQLEKELREEEERAMETLRAKMQKEEQRLLEIERRIQEEKVAALKQDILEDRYLSDDEKQRLLDEYEKNMRHLEDVLEAEREKQEEELKQRMREKSDKRKIMQQKKQEHELIQNQVQQKQEEDTLQLETRLAEDRMRLEEDLRQEEEQEKARIAVETEQTMAAERQRLADELAEATGQEREALLAKHEEDLQNLEHTLNREKMKQEELLASQLSRRRADRERRLAEQHERERARKAEQQIQELTHLEQLLEPVQTLADTDTDHGFSQAVHLNPIVTQAVESVTSSLVVEVPREDVEALQKEQEKKLKELERRQQEEKERLQRQMEEEQRQEEEKLKQEQRAKEEAAEKERQTIQARIEAEKEAAHDEGERRRLLAEHENQLVALENTLQTEKQKQEEMLRAKLAQRNRKKVKDLQKKQQDEVETVVAEEKQASSALVNDLARKKEKEALRMIVQSVPADFVPEAISLVVKQRHENESNELISKLFTDKARRLKNELQALFDAKTEEIRSLKVELEAALAELAAAKQAGALSPSQFEMQRTQLTVNEKRKAQGLDSQYASAQQNVESTIRAEAEAIQKQLMDELRAKQQAEMREILTQFVEPAILQQMDENRAKASETTAEDMKMSEEELEAFRRRVLSEKEAKIREIEEEVRQEEMARLRELEQEAAEFEKQLEEQRRQEEEDAVSRMNQQKERLLREKQEMQRRELEKMGEISEQMKSHILDQHKLDLQELENTMDAERQRQLTKMQERLKKKREAREQKEREKREKQLRQWREEQSTRHMMKIEEIEKETQEKMKSESFVKAATVATVATHWKKQQPTPPSTASSPSPSTRPALTVVTSDEPAVTVAKPSAPSQAVPRKESAPAPVSVSAAAPATVSSTAAAPVTTVVATDARGPFVNATASAVGQPMDMNVLTQKLARVEQVLEGVQTSQLKMLIQMFGSLSELVEALRTDVTDAHIVHPQTSQQLNRVIDELKTSVRHQKTSRR